ncbi:hypothetical protein DH2020_005801 [Rehmannia glutinosa]|uniref:ATP-dependent DNA helicase n=1 Tax=Rehmannia glutinosa TaxID=99300 RepID=A0ABR0XH55_REHGL
MSAVQSNRGRMFFVYGYGGTGKTYLWRALSSGLRSKGHIVLNVASSGIAALLLPGGRTAHSRFLIPINPNESSTCEIKMGSPLAELIVRCKLIIWDEAPMMNKYCFQAVEKSIRDIMIATFTDTPDVPFGGKKSCLVGTLDRYCRTCKSDANVDFLHDLHTPEFLNGIRCSGVPNHELHLKVGTPVMLLRNIDYSIGLCNGTRLVITRLSPHVLECKILTGANVGHKVLIPRMTLTPSDLRIPFKFQRRQFPLIVSYAMTINKSQGQSLSHVGIYLKKPVFSHGQLYVAVSRVTHPKGLKILVCGDDTSNDGQTNNVVYKEVFQNL